ncbi:hypothetical protein MMC22_011035 [Lobaria immixta]|nr:hypothetical protein [Lobaria immixta]
MRVLQILFTLLLVFIPSPLSFPHTTTRRDNGQPGDIDFADTFSTPNCYCFGPEDETVPVPQHYRSGSCFGISYYNREFELMYTRTMWEVDFDGRLLRPTFNRDEYTKCAAGKGFAMAARQNAANEAMTYLVEQRPTDPDGNFGA